MTRKHWSHYIIILFIHTCVIAIMSGGTCVTYMNRLVILQKRIIRITARVRPRSHPKPLFKELNILNIEYIGNFQSARFLCITSIIIIPKIFSFQCLQEIQKSTLVRHNNRITFTFHWSERKLVKPTLDIKAPLFGMTSWKVALELMKVNMFLSKIWDIWLWMVCCDIYVIFYHMYWCEMRISISICACIFTCQCIWICVQIYLCEKFVSMYVYIPIARHMCLPMFLP